MNEQQRSKSDSFFWAISFALITALSVILLFPLFLDNLFDDPPLGQIAFLSAILGWIAGFEFGRPAGWPPNPD